MYRTASSLLFITVLLLSFPAAGQCCTTPDGGPYYDQVIIWDGEDVVGRSISFDDTLFIDGNMSIINSTVVMNGRGMVLNRSSSLNVVNSVLTSGSPDHGFFMDMKGRVTLQNVTLDGCIDEEVGYFGLYLDDTFFRGKDVIMKRSGMIRLEGGSLVLESSVINGIMSYSGNMTIKDMVIDQMGVNHYGQGRIDILDTRVFSSIPYTQTAGLSFVEGPAVSIDGLEVNGSFNAGVYIDSGSISVEDAQIDIPEGIFGLSASDSMVEDLKNLTITGPEAGIELQDCLFEGDLSSSRIEASYIGISLHGNGPFSMHDSTIAGSSYGLAASAPFKVEGSLFTDNEVCLLIEDGSAVNVTACRFVNFGQWAVEDETWVESNYPYNEYLPSNESHGVIAWWGWLDLEVMGPGEIPVSGAEVVLSSSLGSRLVVQDTRVGAIWGYRGADGKVEAVNYTLEAKWGTARTNMDVIPMEDRDLKIVLPLTDIYLSHIEYEEGRALITVMSNRSAAKEVTVEVFVDGRSWNHEVIEISADDERTVSMELPKLDTGAHTIEARASSRYEYSGLDGYLLGNNARTTDITIERERDDGYVSIMLAGLISFSIAMLIGIILLRRKD